MGSENVESINPLTLGKRLADARRARRLSQEDVARQLGVSRPLVVEIEKGSRSPKPEEIIALAALFGRTVHELVGKHEFIAEFAPQFRLPSSVPIPEEARTEAVDAFRRLCEDYLSLEKLRNAPMPQRAPEPYNIAGLSPRVAAEEVALSERARLQLGEGPLANLYDILETQVGLRVFVFPLPAKAARIAGMFVYTDALGGCILVNGVHPPVRRVYSAAHEFAHFLCDRYRSEVTVLEEHERKPRAEQVADYFASCFLMPAVGLRQRFRAIVQNRGDFTVADLCYLADQYGVSVEALTRRLEDMDCIRKGTWLRLSGKGFEGRRGQEAVGISVRQEPPMRLPQRYCRLAVEAYEEEQISESELMRFLRCSRVEAREMVEELTRPVELDSQGLPYQLPLNFGETVELAASEKE